MRRPKLSLQEYLRQARRGHTLADAVRARIVPRTTLVEFLRGHHALSGRNLLAMYDWTKKGFCLEATLRAMVPTPAAVPSAPTPRSSRAPGHYRT